MSFGGDRDRTVGRLRGGRMTKWKGQAASCAPLVGLVVIALGGGIDTADAACMDQPGNPGAARATGGSNCTASSSVYTGDGTGWDYFSGNQPVFETQASTLTLDAADVTITATASDPAGPPSYAVNAYVDSTVHFLGNATVNSGSSQYTRGLYVQNSPGSARAAILVDGNLAVHRDTFGSGTGVMVDALDQSDIVIGGGLTAIGIGTEGVRAARNATIVVDGDTHVEASGRGISSRNFSNTGNDGSSLVLLKGDLELVSGANGLEATGNLNNTIIINGHADVTVSGDGAYGAYAANGGKIFIDPSATAGTADNDTKIVMTDGSVRASGTNAVGLGALITDTTSDGDITVDMRGGSVSGIAYGIEAQNAGTGAIDIRTAGEVSATGILSTGPAFPTEDAPSSAYNIQSAIFAYAGPQASTISIDASGPVSGGAAGIVALSDATGTVRIGATGPVTASDGAGVIVLNQGTAGTEVKVADVAADGPITDGQTAPFGVHVLQGKTAGDVDVSADGTVSGTVGGIRVFSRSLTGNVNVTSNGDISSSQGYGIIANIDIGTPAPTGSTNVVANGDIDAVTGGIVSINGGSGDVSVTANGNVTATDDNSTAIGVTTTKGTARVHTTGNVKGGLTGIQAQVSGLNGGAGEVEIVADGDVETTGTDAIPLISGAIMTFTAGDVAKVGITTGGKVTSASSGINLVNFQDPATSVNVPATVTVKAGSMVEGGIAGISAYSSNEQMVEINNAGEVRNRSQSSADIAINNPGAISLDGQTFPASQASMKIANSGLVLGTLDLQSETVQGNSFVNEAGGIWNTAGGVNRLGAVGADGAPLAANTIETKAGSVIIAAAANGPQTTQFTGLSTFTHGGVLTMQDGVAGDSAVIDGGYAGNGGLAMLDTVLGDDSSMTDRLVINGGTSGTTTLKVANAGGTGAQTVEGIKVVDVTGASDGAFSLAGDFVFKGDQAVVAGAYAYRLFQGGTSTPTDGDWYLRSALTNGDPQYNPGVPVYELYPQHLLGLNSLPTLQQRVGNRYWSGEGANMVAQGADAVRAENPAPDGVTPTYTESSAFWARIEGQHVSMDPDVSTSGAGYDQNLFRVQTGIDFQLMENEAGRLIGGITGHYLNGKSDIDAASGDGSISTDGYGLGGTLTWYGNNGFYVDDQAQVTWYDSNLRSSTAGRVLAEGNDGLGYAFSIETGKRIELSDGLTLTPQAQLAYSNVDLDSFSDPWGAGVALKEDDSLRGRLGISLDKEASWMAPDGTLSRSHVYGLANLHYEFLDGTRVEVAGVSFDNRPERAWGEIGAGVSYNWNDDKYALYGETSLSTGLGDFGDSYAVKGTAGFRVRW